ncbi:ribosome biosynthesis protein RRP14 KNAG_0H00330 [Huiozyma naganishii CBS 8797]|uniref:Ribosomal RNA-processing protein 14/surfeit locus protein 6 C-terminal domain-containing protein n=1 Tax=Huiozyma naganishii (strain ATCC MYA-139 / BCRC 22969 / CBS 8797 / KCTC 17520 / NBRC 10181 / NCYC 3082 / Yp74L-3) TaxID=1071383 RepID=J7S8A6_HUIN7|nr:hypothetical protein KNAG_0H00330 [Kazachstania naganishii CBS 8797]CCK71449.1 hypothetical protein KNAG_0H00330 [Kazachstania naganishii CBS 8797]
MSQSLEQRLRENARAFDGLLSLIPAKLYYDEDTAEQWKAKRKTRDEARGDRVKKLDPDLQEDATALEVMEKRQRDALPVRLPGEAAKQAAKKAAEAEAEGETADSAESASEHEEARQNISVVFDDEGNEVGTDGRRERKSEPESESLESKEATPDAKPAASASASAQSKRNLEELRSKLQSKIQQMKNKRRAPGSQAEGAPASREQILSLRKRKAELRKRKIEEVEDSDSESEKSDSDADGDAQGGVDTTGVMFQNIMFNDGERATSDLQKLRRKLARKGKGPANNDIRAHLKLVEDQKAKLKGKDELDQIKQLEKSKWQKAMLQAEGIKLKDDEKLLRKSLKRKEAKKRKSALEWSERQRAVQQNKSDRAQRREENLKIRKDNKGVKRSKQQKMKRKFKSTVAPKKRAGFEGRLKRK